MSAPAAGTVTVGSKFSGWESAKLQFVRPPNPYLDYASFVLPDNVTDLYKLCTFVAVSNPVVGTALVRKATLPVTRPLIRSKTRIEQRAWEDLLLERLRVIDTLVAYNMSKYTYGHGAVSVLPPFNKYMICSRCGKQYLAKAVRYELDAHSRKFMVRCTKCGPTVAKVVDVPLAVPERIRLRVWGPFEIDRVQQGYTQDDTFYYNPPTWFANQVKMGRMDAINDTPQDLVEAILARKRYRFHPGRVFVGEETSLPSPSPDAKCSWKYGSVLSVLREAMHMQLALKAEEVQLVTQLIPFRAFAPGPSGNPLADVHVAGVDGWMDMMRREIQAWQKDPGYIGIFPTGATPVDLRGTTAPLLPEKEVMVMIDRLLMGMRMPRELVLSGLSWSGSSTSLRVLENDFRSDQMQQKSLLTFISREIHRITRWAVPSFIMPPIVAADEVQRMSMLQGAVSGGIVSRQTYYERLGLVASEEEDNLDNEMRRQITRQARLQSLQAQVAPQIPQAPGMEGEAPPGEEGAPGQEGGPLPPEDMSGSHGTPETLMDIIPPVGTNPGAVSEAAQYMRALPAATRAYYMMRIQHVNPEFQAALFAELDPATAGAGRPNPEIMPPRRVLRSI